MFYAKLMKLLKLYPQDFEWEELDRVYHFIEMLVNNGHHEVSPQFISRSVSLSVEKSTILLIFLFQLGYVYIRARVLCSLGQLIGNWDMPRCDTFEESYQALLEQLREKEEIEECVHCGDDHGRTLEDLVTLYFFLDLEQTRGDIEKKKTFHKREERRLEEMFPKAFQAAAAL